MYSAITPKTVPDKTLDLSAPKLPSQASESKPLSPSLGAPPTDSFSRAPASGSLSRAPITPRVGVASPGAVARTTTPLAFNHAPVRGGESTAAVGTAAAASEFYEIFTSDEDAMKSIHSINARSRRPEAVLPRPNRLYKELDEVIAVIMEGFRDLYPEVVGDLPNPRGVILEDPSRNAFVFHHNVNPGGKAPYYIVVNTGATDPTLGSGALLGVIAHELTHLFFRHSRKEVRAGLDKYYAVMGDEEPLGFLEENNPTVEKIVKAYVKASTVGNRGRLRFIRRSFPLDNFRWYSTEEHADDTSVRIMHSLGLDPLGVAEFNLHWLPPAERAACKARVEAGETVPYGDLTDSHHSDCWRYKHALDLSRTLR